MTLTITTTNEPIETGSTSLTGPLLRADTFVSGHILFHRTGPAASGRTFQDEREAFALLLPELRMRHPGEWVAISGGAVAEHDRDRKVVTLRFFQNWNRGPVYIGFVGRNPRIRQATPFRAQRRA